MLKPLLVSDAVDLAFEAGPGLPPLDTDESKVSQILRNFISNALKFTERGAVRVEARLDAGGEQVTFAVHDTGIGIAPEDRELIFEEFTQIPSALQRKVKGTGLGLPLCRKLAELLGGSVDVQSEPGKGSSFYAHVPVRYRASEAALPPEEAPAPVPAGPWIMVVEDDPATRMLYEKYVKGSAFAMVSSASLAAARERLAAHAASAIILDMGLPGEEEKTWRWLAELKAQPGGPPVIVASMSGEERKARSLGADAYLPKPVDRDTLLGTLARLVPPADSEIALIIDDDEAARYVIRRSVREPMQFEEASDGASGLAAAARLSPRVIFLDLAMPGMTGDEVLERLAADPRTSAIPVVVVTSQDMEPTRAKRIRARARAILQKRDLSVETVSATLEAIRIHP